MKNDDQLFELIQSLTQPEKRYFRMEVSKYTSTDSHDYLNLYEWIEKQNDYDEEKLKKYFKNTPLINRLASTKNYLYNLILKTLTIYHAERSSFSRISWLLQEVDSLFSRGLYKPAKKLLDKAKKVAETYQQPIFMLMIHHWEYHFAELTEQMSKSEAEMLRIKKEEEKMFGELKNKLAIEHLHETTMRFMYKKGMSRNEADRNEYVALLDHPTIKQTENSELQYVHNLRYSILGICNYMLINKELSQEYSLKRVQSFELVPHIVAEDNYEYVVSVFNALQTFYLEKRYEEALAQIERCNTLLEQPGVQTTKQSEEILFLINSFHLSCIWMAQGKYNEVAKKSYDIKKKYDYWYEQPHRNRTLFIVPSAMSICHFVLQNNDEALYWIRLILNDTSKSVRNDALGIARILHLLIQYELDNRSILESYLDSTQRYINENDNMHQFEQVMLRFVRQLINRAVGDKKYVAALEKLKADFEKMVLTDSFEKLCIEQYHLISWVESKLEKRSFLSVVLGKL